MKSIRFILLGLFSASVCATAGPATAPTTAPTTAPGLVAPSTQPAHLSNAVRDQIRQERREFLRGNAQVNANLNPADSAQTNPPTQDEIDATLKFAQENFPNHYSFFTRLSANGQFRNKVALPKMVEKYRLLMHLKDTNLDAYQSMMQQSRLQDQALGFARDLKNGVADAESKLHDSISDMVDKSLTDRRERIMRLRRMLDQQEGKLDQDVRNRDKLVIEQIDKTQKEAERMLKGKDGVTTTETSDATTRPADQPSPAQPAAAGTIEPVNALTSPAQ